MVSMENMQPSADNMKNTPAEPQGAFAEAQMNDGRVGIFHTDPKFFENLKYADGSVINPGDTIVLNNPKLQEAGMNLNRRFKVVGVAPEYRGWEAHRDVGDFNKAFPSDPKLALWVIDPTNNRASTVEKNLLERSFKWSE